MFFPNQEKKRIRNRDFVSGNPLPQQPRIQLAPAAAGLGGTSLTQKGAGASWPLTHECRGLAGVWGAVGPLFWLDVHGDAPGSFTSLPDFISQPASWQGCSGSLTFPPQDLFWFWGPGCPRGHSAKTLEVLQAFFTLWNWQLRSFLILQSHLCTSLPMTVAFAPGLHPISYFLFVFLFAFYFKSYFI